jgi:hypothetical protein
MLAQELPEKRPELPIVEGLPEEGPPDPLAVARQASQIAARRDAEFIRDLVERRDILVDQLTWLYRPHPKVHGRTPDGPKLLQALAAEMLKDKKAVDALLERVVGE